MEASLEAIPPLETFELGSPGTLKHPTPRRAPPPTTFDQLAQNHIASSKDPQRLPPITYKPIHFSSTFIEVCEARTNQPEKQITGARTKSIEIKKQAFSTRIGILAVFEGISDKDCIEYIVSHLHKYLKMEFNEYVENLEEANIHNAIQNAFSKLFNSYRGTSKAEITVVLHIDSDLWVIQSGNTNAVFIGKEGVHELTRDFHFGSPTVKKKTSRPILNGQKVKPGLKVDFVTKDLKCLTEKLAIVKCSLSDLSNGSLVIATRGLWATLKTHGVVEETLFHKECGFSPALLAQTLIETAYSKGLTSNVALIVADTLPAVSPPPPSLNACQTLYELSVFLSQTTVNPHTQLDHPAIIDRFQKTWNSAKSNPREEIFAQLVSSRLLEIHRHLEDFPKEVFSRQYRAIKQPLEQLQEGQTKMEQNLKAAITQQVTDKQQGFTLWDQQPSQKEPFPLPQIACQQFAPVATSQGARDTMEDFHMEASFTLASGEKGHLFGVFDGHSGAMAAEYVANNLEEFLTDRLNKFYVNGHSSDGIRQALEETFIDINEKLRIDTGGGCSAGTTATAALLLAGKIWVASVGDTRAMFCDESKIIQLSEDARTTSLRFIKIVGEHGGYIEEDSMHPGHFRVGGEIGMATAIGDHAVRGITPIAMVTSLPLSKAPSPHAHLILASDGLFEFATTNEVGEAVQQLYQNSCAADQIASTLAYSALKVDPDDNITVMVVPLAKLLHQGVQ